MFDAAERLLLWNQSYLDLSGLSPAFMTPERTLTELLTERRAIGTLTLDIEPYIKDIRDTVARGEPKTVVFENSAGRCNKVITVPMPTGGWLATYEDITEQVKVRRIVENQTMQLNAAIANMPQGLCMFDKRPAPDRLQQAICQTLWSRSGAKQARHAAAGYSRVLGRVGDRARETRNFTSTIASARSSAASSINLSIICRTGVTSLSCTNRCRVVAGSQPMKTSPMPSAGKNCSGCCLKTARWQCG